MLNAHKRAGGSFMRSGSGDSSTVNILSDHNAPCAGQGGRAMPKTVYDLVYGTGAPRELT